MINSWLPIEDAYLPPKATPHLSLKWSLLRSMFTAVLFAKKVEGMGIANVNAYKCPRTPSIFVTLNGKDVNIVQIRGNKESEYAAHQIEDQDLWC